MNMEKPLRSCSATFTDLHKPILYVNLRLNLIKCTCTKKVASQGFSFGIAAKVSI